MTWAVNGFAFLGALMVAGLLFAAITDCIESWLRARRPKVVEIRVPQVVEVRVPDDTEVTERSVLEEAIEERVASIIEGRTGATGEVLPPLSAEELLQRRR